MLARNRGRLITYRELLNSVWGPGYSEDTQVLRAHVANLRRKIEPPDRTPVHQDRSWSRIPLRRVRRAAPFTQS